MRSIALGLDLPEHFFDASMDEKCHNLRLLSYPPMKTNLLREEGQYRAGAHSGSRFSLPMLNNPNQNFKDYGSITLLFQDSIGGLEVQNPQTGKFIPASPIVSQTPHVVVPIHNHS
jgi:isopenicillin N synthase-like dioxygenase